MPYCWINLEFTLFSVTCAATIYQYTTCTMQHTLAPMRQWINKLLNLHILLVNNNKIRNHNNHLLCFVFVYELSTHTVIVYNYLLIFLYFYFVRFRSFIFFVGRRRLRCCFPFNRLLYLSQQNDQFMYILIIENGKSYVVNVKACAWKGGILLAYKMLMNL